MDIACIFPKGSLDSCRHWPAFSEEYQPAHDLPGEGWRSFRRWNSRSGNKYLDSPQVL